MPSLSPVNFDTEALYDAMTACGVDGDQLNTVAGAMMDHYNNTLAVADVCSVLTWAGVQPIQALRVRRHLLTVGPNTMKPGAGARSSSRPHYITLSQHGRALPRACARSA